MGYPGYNGNACAYKAISVISCTGVGVESGTSTTNFAFPQKVQVREGKGWEPSGQTDREPTDLAGEGLGETQNAGTEATSRTHSQSAS